MPSWSPLGLGALAAAAALTAVVLRRRARSPPAAAAAAAGPDGVRRFYDELSDQYDAMFESWDGAVRRQGSALAGLVRSRHPRARRVLDCACGIGTQAVGLALEGFLVRGSDLSGEAVRRAAREAARLGAGANALGFHEASFLDLERAVPGDGYDVVVALDNALPHVLTDSDTVRALRQMRAKLAPDGLLMLSVRDYDRILRDRVDGVPVRTHERANGGAQITFQTWDWAADRSSYELSLFVLTSGGGGVGGAGRGGGLGAGGEAWETRCYKTRYRALTRAALNDALERAGFEEVEWLEPGETQFYQLLVLARRGQALPRSESV